MRIDGLGGPPPPTPAPRGRRSKAGFADLVEPDGPCAGEAAAGGGVAPAAALPATPGPVGDPQLRDREAHRHGAAMLDALASLQASLLAGNGDSVGEALAALAETRPQADDPGLEDALAAIAVRAAVERAKRG